MHLMRLNKVVFLLPNQQVIDVQKKIRLTQRGVVLASAWDACCDEIDEAMLKGFSADECKSFATLLMRVRENLENYVRGEA